MAENQTTQRSWKDEVDKIEGPEKDHIVYDFQGPKGEGKFKKPADETGTGIYE